MRVKEQMNPSSSLIESTWRHRASRQPRSTLFNGRVPVTLQMIVLTKRLHSVRNFLYYLTLHLLWNTLLGMVLLQFKMKMYAIVHHKLERYTGN
ncbi:hypothetical protein PoB_000149100 [Plakobranchus ocellatus]|uniref:Uncharacterized protein n=1 Tax=Plakobranchus ocellatus TaxID=259542 RepID=A0AAV3XW05_9GAST|nr:hypothetical protein PoB_000149100 [Plakobranchus ocellatus]